MKDIARDVGVSIVTVSKVLRNHGDISEPTRQRVLQRMQELNYRPDPVARALATGRTHTLGLVVPDLVYPFFSHLATGLSRALREKGYSLLIASSEEDPDLERQEIESLLARRVNALLVASTQGSMESFRYIAESTPYVLIDRQFDGLAANFVGVDDQRVGEMATSHLIETGCRRIAHIRGPEVSTALGRLEGYRRALAECGISPSDEYVVAGTSGGYEAMRRLLAIQPPPDGVFCYSDPLAMDAMTALLEAGLRIPDDVAVVGCGNVHYADLLRVPLSSIDQDSVSIGERAATLALSLVDGKAGVNPQSVLLEPRLVVRASSARAARA